MEFAICQHLPCRKMQIGGYVYMSNYYLLEKGRLRFVPFFSVGVQQHQVLQGDSQIACSMAQVPFVFVLDIWLPFLPQLK